MKRTPAFVRYPVGRSPWLRRWLLGLWSTGALFTLLAVFSPFMSVWHAQKTIILIAFVALAGWALRRFWHSQQPRYLVWTGENWQLEQEDHTPLPQPGCVEVRLDAQYGLLLYYRQVSQRCMTGTWLWADAQADPQRWHLLRCALYFLPAGVASAAMSERA